MQLHSIQFWMDHVGVAGAGWSLMLESVVIWFWWNNRTSLALIASLLLVFGPIYEITKPAIAELEQQQQLAALNQVDRNEIERLEASLATYNGNSEKRSGWLPKINEIQLRIDDAQDRIRNRNTEQSKFDEAISTAIAIAQCLALLIIMTAQAMAISKQRKITESRMNSEFQLISKPETTAIEIRNSTRNDPRKTKIKHPKIETTAASKLIIAVEKIPAELSKNIDAQGINQVDWCKLNGVSPKHLSLAKSHNKRLQAGKETAPLHILKQICTALNIDTEADQ
jgi:hypothetical protein